MVKSRLSLDSISSEKLLGDFSRFYIMLLLFEGPKHGYEIISKMEDRLGQKSSPSLVYPFLKELEQSEILLSRKETEGKRIRKEYSLTKDGEALCSRLFKQFTTVVSSAIEPSMSVCSHCGCRVFKDAHHEIIRGRNLAFCCEYCAASYRKVRSGKRGRKHGD
ncbi:MAG TPA: PadR family transcriptional regulator [Nitrososphaerales archaeon]|nr:PadR family transcriptional regulator [Nitrososphaerales archaeon]